MAQETTAAQTSATVYTCVACQQATGTADRMLNLALDGRKVEQAVLCRPCGQDARDFGHMVYHLQATLDMIARRKAERIEREASRQKSSMEFFGNLGGKAPAEGSSEEPDRQATARARRAGKQVARDEREQTRYRPARDGAANGHRPALVG